MTVVRVMARLFKRLYLFSGAHSLRTQHGCCRWVGVLCALAAIQVFAQPATVPASTSTAAPTTTASPAQKPILIGAVISQTGMLADLATPMRDALLMWQEKVNDSGGLLGRPIELRIYDDGSEATRSTHLYELLARDDQADILIGPFGSAATSMAVAVADRTRRVMINTTGTSPAIHKRSPRWTFQLPPTSDRMTAGLVPLARAAGIKSFTLAARDEPAAADLLARLREAAEPAGLLIRPTTYYTPGNLVDLAPYAAQLKPEGVEAMLSPANAREAANLLRGLKAVDISPRLFVATGVTDPEYIAQVGVDAEYSLGFSTYEPVLRTQGNAAFVRMWRARYKSAPGFSAAAGWAAGQLIEAAVAQAQSVAPLVLREALLGLETQTVLGPYKVNADGAQLAAQPFMVQILQGRREVVWPETVASAQAVLPMPTWDKRPRFGRR